MCERNDVMRVAISDLMAILSQNAHMKEQIQELQEKNTKEVERRRRMAKKKRKKETELFICDSCEEEVTSERHGCESCHGQTCEECWDAGRNLCANCTEEIDDSDDDLGDDAWDDGSLEDDDDDDDDLDDDAWDSDIEPDDDDDW